MASLDARLMTLEAVSKAPDPYDLSLMPGQKRMAVLVMCGPDEQAEIEALRAHGHAAELDTPENCARWLG